MASTSSDQAYLPGVVSLQVQASLGPATAFPQMRMRKTFTLSNLPAIVHCPNRCHNGGFDLARDLYDGAARRMATAHKGKLKCRGYEELGRHRRQACNYTLEYDAALGYGALRS